MRVEFFFHHFFAQTSLLSIQNTSCLSVCMCVIYFLLPVLLLKLQLIFIFDFEISFLNLFEYFSRFRWARLDKARQSCTVVDAHIQKLLHDREWDGQLHVSFDILAVRRPSS